MLTTHVNPDADAIGSEIAFYLLLKTLNKDVKIINFSLTPYFLKFLDTDDVIQHYNPELHDKLFTESDVLVALDFNRLQRLVKMEPLFRNSNAVKICIDHHQEPENFTQHYFNGTDYCATAHIIYDFISQTQIVPLDAKLAIPLYAAIMTDTGSFRFDRTTSEVHQIAAHLIELGVVPNEIHDLVYDQNSIGKLKLLGDALHSIQMFGAKNELAVMVIRKDDLERNNTTEIDTDGFINICMSIQTAIVAMKFLELSDGFKVSLRSKGSFSVHSLAGEFGGGGHQNASGIRFRGIKLDSKMNEIIQKALEHLEKYEG